MNFRKPFIFTFAIVLGVFAATNVLAWTAPSASPPSSNATAPLNVSNVGQIKLGGLQLNTGGAATGLIVGGATILNGGSNTNWAPLNVGSYGTVSINALGTIYSYGAICTGNNDGGCASTGGVVLKANGNLYAAGNVGINNIAPAQRLTVGTTNGVSNALISARANGDALEWGHQNTAGYGATLGAYYNSGNPYVAFDAQAGTNPNTFKTNGVKGAVMVSDLAGGFVFDTVPAASADNQATTYLAGISSAGKITVASDVCINGGKCLSSSNAGPVIFGGMFANRSDNGVNIAANPWTGGGSCPSWAPTLRSASSYICCTTAPIVYYCTN